MKEALVKELFPIFSHLRKPMQQHHTLITRETCAWPNLFSLDHQHIGAVIFNKPSHGLEEGDLDLWVMKRDDYTWKYRGRPAPHEPGENRMHAACGVDPDGTIIVLSTGYAVKNGKYVQLRPMWCSSSAKGQNWDIVKDISLDAIDKAFIPHGPILCVGSALFATVYASYGRGNPSYSWVIVSNDKGKSWAVHSLIGDGDTNECSLLQVDNSCWLVAARTHIDHHTRLYYSHDQGVTWHWQGPLTLPMQHPGHLLGIGNDAVLLTYGIRNRGLMAIGGRISLDKGKTWSPPFVLTQFPPTTTDCGYPSTSLLKDGLCLTGYYTNSSEMYNGYQFGTILWQLADYLTPKQLASLSDNQKMIY